MEEVIAAQAEKQQHKKPFKKLLFLAGIVFGSLIVLALILTLATQFLNKKPAPKEEVKVQEKKDESIIPALKTTSYRVQTPPINPAMTFIYTSRAKPLFSPLTVYYLTTDNQLFSTPFFINTASLSASPWCFGNGEDVNTASQDKLSMYCLENRGNKELYIRRLDMKSKEYKEYVFTSENDLFLDTASSRVISSRDGDTVLIYSPAAAYILESATSNLYKTDIPLNLTFVKAVPISNVETALITDTGKIYRINFSNHKGGIFDVNFVGLTEDQLKKGLSTTRLSKDARRLVFTISDLLENLPSKEQPNYQQIVAYNIDLETAKVSDELNYEEKFLVSCKNLIGSRFCIYKYFETTKPENKDLFFDIVYVKEFASGLNEALNIRTYKDGRINTLDPIDSNQTYFFIRSFVFADPNDPKPDKKTPIVYVYNTTAKTLTPLNF